jgi:TolB protein
MKTKIRLIISAILIAHATVSAQEENVPKIMFDTLRVGTVEPTPIGVDNMKYIGTAYITSEDSTLMNYVTTVVSNDIDFYADFDLIPVDSFFIKTYEIVELDLAAWKRLGADYVLKLEAEFPGANMRVHWKIFYTFNNRQVENGRFEMHRDQWREMSHMIANEVVKTLTGEKGIFLTKVAFIKKIDKAKEIFISDYDGANARQLTKNGSINISPSFSPDGKEIYFTSFVETDPKVFKVNVASGRITKVTDFPGLSAAPRVAPDGKRIACVLSKDGNSEIYELDLQGKVKKRLTQHAAIETAPSWSPDGELLAFTSDRSGRPQVYIMDKNGDKQRRLTYEGRYNDSPSWSARGDRVIFVSRTESGRFDIASVDTNGYDYHAMTEVGMNENPNFSPDGKHIIFSSTRLGGSDIFTMDVTGRHQRRLTRDSNCTNPVWGPID